MTSLAPESAPVAATPTGGPERRSWRSEAIDVGFVAVAVALGLIGFGTVYESPGYLVAGGVGIVAGAAIGWWTGRTRQPALVVAAAALAAFFLLGGPAALGSVASGGVFPNAAVLKGLVDGAVRGWAKLLTVVPPAGESGNLLVVPFVCGLVGSLLASTTAVRGTRRFWTLTPIVAVLVVSILFGSAEPASLILQGALFAGLMAGWVALRHASSNRLAMWRGGRTRMVGATAMLGLSVLGAASIGGNLPKAGEHERFILRERAQPPFDPKEYPSPLNGYRSYVSEKKKTTLFTVDGLRAGDRLRLAVLDRYDGVVFGVAGSEGERGSASGYFARIGGELTPEKDGAHREVTVHVDDYSDVWVPTVGELVDVSFSGRRTAELEDAFRYNQATDAGALIGGLRRGDQYRLDVVIPPEVDDARIKKLGLGSAPVLQPDTTEPVKKRAVALTKDVTSANAGAIVASLAAKLREGGYTDGGEGDPVQVPPGHHAQRLESFIKPDVIQQWAGNGEQYSATAAIMAQTLGVPTRVVMGFAPKVAGSGPVGITGADVDAWIEVNLAGVDWVPVLTTPQARNPPEAVTPPVPNQASRGGTPPPPPPVTVPVTDVDSAEKPKDRKDRKEREDARESAGGIPTAVIVGGTAVGIPVLLIGGAAALILALKRRRARRRRTVGPPSRRVAAGWLEITDLARDLGQPVPAASTRREVAQLLDAASVEQLARGADSAVFAAGEPSESTVDAFWEGVGETKAALLDRLGRVERTKARLNLTSLRVRSDESRLRPLNGSASTTNGRSAPAPTPGPLAGRGAAHGAVPDGDRATIAETGGVHGDAATIRTDPNRHDGRDGHDGHDDTVVRS